MQYFIISLLSVLFAANGYAGGSSGSGPLGNLANCMANAIVVESSESQPGYIFRNDLLIADDTGLTGFMSPRAFATLKNVVINSRDYSSIQSIIGQNSESVPVRDVYFLENPNAIEMELENDVIIHITPFERPVLKPLKGFEDDRSGFNQPPRAYLPRSLGCTRILPIDLIDIAAKINN